MKIKVLLVASFIVFVGGYSLKAAALETIKFGSVAMDTPAVMHQRLSPLTDYLKQELQRPVELKLSSNMADAINEISAGTVEIAFLTPVAYISAHDSGNSQIVAKTVTDGHASFQLMIVVKQDSPIKTVEDLAGKTFAFGDPAALLQRAAVVGAGMPLDKLGKYEFIGHYDNIARGVARGLFDAGVLTGSTALKWQDKGLRILYSTPHLPPYNIAVSSKVDAALLAQIRRAFLQLDINKPEHKAVIKAISLKYDGFAPTSDAEYDVIRKLIKPFEK
jgi:phosphonate transport system substrate-binding protein